MARKKVTIDKEGWRDVVIENDFVVPTHVKHPQSYILREKVFRYVNNHPYRIYHYVVKGESHSMDCKTSESWLVKSMKAKGACQEDIDEARSISNQLRYFYGILSGYSKKAFGGKSQAGGILESRAEELLDLFGKLHCVTEVHQIITQDWGYSVHKDTVQSWYSRNLKEIERLRETYASDYSDLSLTKKRGRLDRLSVMFYTYFNKWNKDEKLDYSRELRAILEQIKKEVEGEQLNISISGQINVDLTIEINKTLFEAYKRIPVNNLILAMVAAKRGIDPTKLMAQMTNSYYKNLTGYGRYEPEKELVHPVDLTYNWNEIQSRHKGNRKSLLLEDAVIVTSIGNIEKDAEVNTVKMRLLEILEKDKEQNQKRKSGK